jgi:NRAMP (natural resistance-associated macrophage protein)-like metal ion transporter
MTDRKNTRSAAAKQTPPAKKGFFSFLGPGLTTGASDDDPSGIATYSQAGAQFGYNLLWTLLFSLPLMAAVQEISARIGRITGRGIASNIRRYYPKWVLYPIVLLVLVANIINLGADIGAMGDAMRLVFGGSALLYSTVFAILSLLLQIFSCYRNYSKYLRWSCLVLLSYVATVVVVHVPWGEALGSTVLPTITFSGAYVATLIAVLGTTISPYLFFWQASQETEDIKDVARDHPLNIAPEQAPAQFKRIRIDT